MRREENEERKPGIKLLKNQLLRKNRRKGGVVRETTRVEIEGEAEVETGGEAEAKIGDAGAEAGIGETEVEEGETGGRGVTGLGRGEIGEETEAQRGGETESTGGTGAGPGTGRVETARAKIGRITTKHG